MTRLLRLMAVLALVAGPLLAALAVGPATASAAPLRLSLVRVPDRSLPAALRARLADDAAASATAHVFTGEFINADGGGKYCLDANDSGSTAGKNGDKVQLWKCTGASNQIWFTSRENANGYFNFVNARYPSKCLNANDSPTLGDGSKVQLWGCGGEGNDMWMLPGIKVYGPVYLQAGNFVNEYVLDARSQSIGDGDRVQIFTDNGGANQFWSAFPK